jgi:hypothetical protein
VTADSGVGNHAIAGGARNTLVQTQGSNVIGNVQGSFPSNPGGTPQTSGTNPQAWTATFAKADASNTA